MFAEHHIEELEPEYWEKHLGTSKSDPRKALDLLVLHSHWDNDCVFDFTLPEDATNYVIRVRLDESRKIKYIGMEGQKTYHLFSQPKRLRRAV